MTDCIHMTREMAKACPICRAKIDVEEVSGELAKTFSEAVVKTLKLPDTADMIPRAEAERMAQAREAAALREAMKNLRSHLGRLAYDAMQVEDCILALITLDAQSALDSVVREAEARVRAEVVRSMTEASIYALECQISRHEALGNGTVVEALREMLDQERAASAEVAYDDILALIPPAGKGALDSVVAEAISELRGEIAFLKAQIEAWESMAPPPSPDLLRKRLEERAAIRAVDKQ